MTIQLRLWFLAKAVYTPLLSRINLLFQIIECSFPDKKDYPEYDDSTTDPDPRTESKFLRHLSSHGYGLVRNKGLQNYCKRYNLPQNFVDPTDSALMTFLESKVGLVEAEARKIIEKGIGPSY